MWPFKKKEEVGNKIDKLDYALENSFDRVKQDMDNVNRWISYLYNQDLERQKLIEIIHSQMQHLSVVSAQPPAVREVHHPVAVPAHFDEKVMQVEQKIDALNFSIKAIEPIVDRVAKLNSQVKMVEESQNSVFEKLREFSSRIEKAEAPRQRTTSNLREKIIRKVARHSKEYIKNLLLSSIGRYDQISALQLREMIVEEQGLCSKSTFYRILEEIEAENSVEMLARGKEKVYLPKLAKKQHHA